MKRALPYVLLIALVLVVPAVPQDDGADELAKRVEELEKKVEEQTKLLKALDEYVMVQKAESAALAKKLSVAEKKGFLYPAPHVDAKKALLGGLSRYATVLATGEAPPDSEE